jgi:penicillin-binding protein 1C
MAGRVQLDVAGLQPERDILFIDGDLDGAVAVEVDPASCLPPAPVIATTLDLPLQAALERLAGSQLAVLPPRVSLAVVIADVRSREMRAIYGGAWGDEARGGALDLSRAVRSPGSALKPFIYALAFEDGIASADSWLTDLPRHYGGYAPENFDRGFAGRVTAGEALRRSLNLPAVALLDRVGPTRYAAALRATGITLRLPPGEAPSLPLALGGLGIGLRDVAALYAGLASDGSIGRLRLQPQAPAVRRPFVEPHVARAVADVLTQPFPGTAGITGIAWKTGTSWGGRDAWAVGFDAAHVVAVWVGRPDGTPIPGATGRGLALPLLARVFDLLPSAPRHGGGAPPPLAVALPGEDAFRMLFPPPGAVVSAGDMVIRMMGGRRPLVFMVDGAKLPTEPAAREARWRPPGPGFYRLTVLDADGAAARAELRVRE